MIVTINTDASYRPKIKRGTYAFWIICNEFKVTMSGALRKKISRPEIAEFQCIMNALFIVLSTDTKNSIHKIIINTDCLNVISLINQDQRMIKRFHLNKWGRNLRNQFLDLIENYGIDISIIEFRHVIGHEHTNTPRNYVNQWCDDHAKIEMIKLLKQHKK